MSCLVVFAVLLLSTSSTGVQASNWPDTAEPNVAVSTAFDRQDSPLVASDGAGGVIVVWQDLRNQLDWNVFAQRIDSHGNAIWTADGVPVCTEIFNQTDPQVMADGAGGAIFVWEDTRGGSGKDIYAQRIDANGTTMWTPDGVVVCQAFLEQQEPRLTTDGAGGAIIAWEDVRTGAVFEIYAQRIDATGAALWGADGVGVATGVLARHPDLAADGAGGAVIAWEDIGAFTNVFAQRIDANANPLWTVGGVAVRPVGWNVTNVHVVSSITNGAIIFWEDALFVDHDIDGSRVLGDGTVLPVFNVSVGLGDHRDAQVVSDGNNGALLTFPRAVGPDDAIAVQRVGINGPLWNNGQPVTFAAPASLTERNPQIAADASGGAVIVWEDDRNGTPDLFAMGLANDGSVTWGEDGNRDGVAVTTALGDQFSPQLVADDNGGAVVVWQDQRVSVIRDDVYAQRIEGNGHVGYPSGDISTIVDVPQDNGGHVILSWGASVLDAFPTQTVTHYSVWRRPGPFPVSVAGVAPSLDERVRAAVTAGIGPNLAQQMATGGWNFVDTQAASYLSEYSYNAPTYGDSTVAGESLAEFMIITQTDNPFVFWKSLAGSGYSVDNLAPSSPINLTGQTVGNDAQLDWEPPEMYGGDITHYNVYRNQLSSVSPVPGNFLTSVPDLALLDVTTGGLLHYYVVTAVDLSEHESAPSNEVSVPVVTGVGDRPPAFPVALTLLPNAPNPFSASTTVRYGLPVSTDVTVEMYDVAGRVVFRDRVASANAGWNTYSFDGRTASGAFLPSGIYLLRMAGAGAVETRKITIAR